ncbi:MAG: hypothetical protein L6R41_006642, partial [Letrouitia leprolyta]
VLILAMIACRNGPEKYGPIPDLQLKAERTTKSKIVHPLWQGLLGQDDTRYYVLLGGIFFSALAMTAISFAQTTPTYTPIPPASIGPPVSNTTGHRVESFGQGAYLITDGLYQAIFLISCSGVMLVDAPPTIGQNIQKAIESITLLPVTHIIYSHAHADHIGAAYLFQQQQGPDRNVTYIAHEDTYAELAQTNSTDDRPAPTLTFANDLNLTVCNQTLHLAYKGPNHQPGNIFIFATRQKILMLVDIIFPGWAPFASLGEAQNIPGFINAHDQVLEYDFQHFVGGHLNRAGTRQDVIVQREYIRDLFATCKDGILLSATAPNASNPLAVQTALAPVVAANPRNSWALFYAYLYELVGVWCANETNTRWAGRLAGVDVFGVVNAVAMVESLRIDFGVLGPYGVV